MNRTIAGIAMPDSAMARGATERVRATESALMFRHAQRAFLFGALTGYRENLVFDIELLYVGAMFHNVGLNIVHRGSSCRYEVDSANAARDFMREHNPEALRDLTERLLEAQQRGLWEAPGDYREALEEQLLDGEEQA